MAVSNFSAHYPTPATSPVAHPIQATPVARKGHTATARIAGGEAA